MRIPCGDGVMSRGSKANRGWRAGKERSHTNIIIKRAGRKTTKERGNERGNEKKIILL